MIWIGVKCGCERMGRRRKFVGVVRKILRGLNGCADGSREMASYFLWAFKLWKAVCLWISLMRVERDCEGIDRRGWDGGGNYYVWLKELSHWRTSGEGKLISL